MVSRFIAGIRGYIRGIGDEPFRTWALACIIALLISIIIATAAMAQDVDVSSKCHWLKADDVANVTITNDDGSGRVANRSFNICQDYQGFTNKAVKCVARVLVDATYEYLVSMAPYYRGIVSAIVLLMVVIYGARLALGQIQANQLRQEMPMTALKMALVLYFVQEMPLWYTYAVCASGDFIQIVAAKLSSSFAISMSCFGGGNGNDECLSLSSGIGDFSLGENEYSVWRYIDCIFGSLIAYVPVDLSAFGFDPARNGPVAAGVIMAFPAGMIITGVIVAAGFSGFLGFSIFFAGVTAMTTMAFSFFKAAFNFMTDIIGLAMMFAIGPLAIPLALFKATNSYFQKWLEVVVRYLIEPILLVALLVLMIWCYDWMIFTGDKSLMKSLFRVEDKVCVADLQKMQEGGFLMPGFVPTFGGSGAKPVFNEVISSTVTGALSSIGSQGFELNASTASKYQINFCRHPNLTEEEKCICAAPGTNPSCGPDFGNEAMKVQIQQNYLYDLLGVFLTFCAVNLLFNGMLENFRSFSSQFSRGLSRYGVYAPSGGDMQVPLESNVKAGIASARQYAAERGLNQDLLGPADIKGEDLEGMARAFGVGDGQRSFGFLGNDMIRSGIESVVGPLGNTPPPQTAPGGGQGGGNTGGGTGTGGVR